MANIEIAYQTLLERTWDTVMTLSREGMIVSSNKAFAWITGWPAEKCVGRLFAELLHPEDVAPWQRQLVEAAEGRTLPSMEIRVAAPSGAMVLLEAAAAWVDGDPGHYVCVARDITNRKQSEKALWEREARFQELVEGTRAVPFEADCLQRRFTYVGPQGMRLLGYPSEKWCTGNFWFEQVHPADRHLVSQFPASATMAAADQEFIYRMIAADGRVVWLLHIARRHSGGRWAQGYLIDVTERHEAQAELERSREQHRALARRIQLAREEERLHIAREIHDELGQSLTCVRMDTLAIRTELAKCELNGIVPELLKRMAALEELTTEAMRSVRRISTKLRPPILDRIGLFAAIEWQANEFESRFGIRCRLERPNNEPAIDPDRGTAVFRIFQEILTNVARHAQAQEVRVGLRCDRGGVKLSVSDDGRGVSADDLTKDRAFGVLGMKERAAAFDGTLEISGGGRGTTVSVFMPLDSESGKLKGRGRTEGAKRSLLR